MPNFHDYVTGSEFARWVAEENNYRERLERRMLGRHEEYIGELREIKDTVKDTNGRIGKAEVRIARIEDQFKDIREEEETIESIVADVRDHGCKQLETHAQVVHTLEGSGALPLIDEPRRGFVLPHLNRKQKAAAGVGIAALLIPAIGQLLSAIEHLFDWLIAIQPGT